MYRDETYSPDAEGAYEAEAIRCHACTPRAQARKEFQEGKGDLGGVFFPIRPAD